VHELEADHGYYIDDSTGLQDCKLPTKLPLSGQCLSPEGAFLIENGFSIILYIGEEISSGFLRDIFGVYDISEVPKFGDVREGTLLLSGGADIDSNNLNNNHGLLTVPGMGNTNKTSNNTTSKRSDSPSSSQGGDNSPKAQLPVTPVSHTIGQTPVSTGPLQKNRRLEQITQIIEHIRHESNLPHMPLFVTVQHRGDVIERNFWDLLIEEKGGGGVTVSYHEFAERVRGGRGSSYGAGFM